MWTWSKVKVEVVFDPRTGSVKPWEIWGVFPEGRVRWASCKTEAAAHKIAEKHRINIAKPDARWRAA